MGLLYITLLKGWIKWWFHPPGSCDAWGARRRFWMLLDHALKRTKCRGSPILRAMLNFRGVYTSLRSRLKTTGEVVLGVGHSQRRYSRNWKILRVANTCNGTMGNRVVTLQGTNISHLWKRIIIWKGIQICVDRTTSQRLWKWWGHRHHQITSVGSVANQHTANHTSCRIDVC